MTDQDRPPIELGVMRDVIRFTAEAINEDAAVEGLGSLIAHMPTDGDGPPFIGEVVIWTLDDRRLRDLLELAADGADIDGLLMSLDAVALLSHQHRDDGELDDPDGA